MAITPGPVKPEPTPVDQTKNPAAVELGRLAGVKGGKDRAKKMAEEQRSEAAKKAALARWAKKNIGNT